LVVTALMFGSLCLSAAFLVLALENLIDSGNKRHVAFELASELRQSSDDLTRLVRSFVSTGDARYKKLYWNVLAIRNGETSRPEDYGTTYIAPTVKDRAPSVPAKSESKVHSLSLHERMVSLPVQFSPKVPFEYSPVMSAEVPM
jgi:hypothetical protein